MLITVLEPELVFFLLALPKEYNIVVIRSASTSKPRTMKVYIEAYPENKHLCPYESVTSLLLRTRL
jgi:hypothetical protein